MTSRAEEQRTIVFSEWSVVGVGSNGVGAWFLFGERNVVFHAIAFLVDVFLFGNLSFEEFKMVVADGEMHVSFAVATCIKSSLNKMLLHGSAGSIFIVVEQK